MEVLHVLEQKVMELIAQMQRLNAEKEQLMAQNNELKEKIELLEHSLLSQDQSSRELLEARDIIDQMIQSINTMVEGAESSSDASLQ